MKPNLARFAAFAAFFALVPGAHGRTLLVTPTDALALEYLEVEATVAFGCERLASVAPDAGGFALYFDRDPDRQCDRVGTVRVTLGAFPPGAYRLRSLVTTANSTPPSEDGETTFTVSPGPRAADPFATQPQVDLSGIWIAPSEPFTGLAFIHSADPAPAPQSRAERVTGLWYDYSSSQPTWSMLLLDGTENPGTFTGNVVRTTATGTGAGRTLAMANIGNATLTRDAAGNWRLVGTIDGRAVDLPLERFRWNRAAWPAL